MFNLNGETYLAGKMAAMSGLQYFRLPAGKLQFPITSGGSDPTQQTTTYMTALDFIYDLQVVKINSYQYRLQYKNIGHSNWTDLPNSTFNGASLLSGSWSGGIFTVSEDPEHGVSVPPNSIKSTGLRYSNTGTATRSGKNIANLENTIGG